MKRVYEDSELILSAEKKIYHLNLHPDEIADTIIVVGDPGRVATVSKFFDSIDIKVQNRELVTHTGYLNNMRITAMSTGMGPDNIDIVINELDALANIDLESRTAKTDHRKLNIIRLGTSGSMQGDVPVDSFVASAYGLGIDGVLNFYKKTSEIIEGEMNDEFIKQTNWPDFLAKPYMVKASGELLEKVAFDMIKGITATAPGFFGPQGRELRGELAIPDLNERLTRFAFKDNRVTNFEMETSALYGLGKILGHDTLTICVIIANRIAKQFSKDYKPLMEKLITTVLERLTAR
ncbi:MAG TPA: nucleoside phosphorylase [Bacteroidales bacterium]|nr:nucleoside phosphorylase [Bacteroidales bacterium]